jgi:hypothetical protein
MLGDVGRDPNVWKRGRRPSAPPLHALDHREADPRVIVRVVEGHGARQRRCDDEEKRTGLSGELHALEL